MALELILRKGEKGTNRDPGIRLDLAVGTAADRPITGRWKRTAEPLAAAEAEQLPPAMAARQTAGRLDPLEQQPRRHGLPKERSGGCVLIPRPTFPLHQVCRAVELQQSMLY
jgi:hypothetical protein